MPEFRESIEKAVKAVRDHSGIVPETGIILGSGLGDLVKEIDIDAEISYEEIPGFPLSTVEFHAGKFILGTLRGKKVAAMQGRFHVYEGYSQKHITFPIRVMKYLGAGTLIISNVSGGLNPSFERGDIMILNDHINLLGDNPLIGPNDDSIGPRYPDMFNTYDPDLIKMVEQIANSENIEVKQGVYASMTGPSLETRAEYKMLRVIGADAVGMSTVPEVIVGVHMGMRILALSVITDMCIPEKLEPVDISEIIQTAGEAEPKLTKLISRVIEEL